MQLEGGGSTSAPKKPSGGGKRRPDSTPAPNPGPPSYSTYTRPAPSSSRAPSGRTTQPAPVVEIATRAAAGPTGFNMNAVSEARAALADQLKEQATPDYSAYTDPHKLAAANNDYAVRTPQQAQELHDRRQDGSPELSIDEKVDKAKSNLYQARLAERRRALGADIQGPRAPGAPAPGVGEVEQMSWEKYQSLSDKERAAIDFNTMLVKAVRRDAKLRDKYEPNEQQRENYDKAVEETFGKDGGSELYAPETVALLRQIDLTDKTGDLDQYLGLNAAITAADLKHLKTVPGPTIYEGTANPVQLNRLEITETLATKTAQMQQSLARGNELLKTITQTARFDPEQQSRLEQYGALPTKFQPEQQLGYGKYAETEAGGPADLNSYFISRFDGLAGSADKKEVGQRLGQIRTELSDSEFQAFMQYADNKTRQADRYNGVLGSNPEIQYNSADDFRKMLGLDGGK